VTEPTGCVSGCIVVVLLIVVFALLVIGMTAQPPADDGAQTEQVGL